MTNSLRRLIARWSAWRALDNHSSIAPRALSDINHLDTLLRKSSHEEATRPANLRRAVMPALSTPAPAPLAPPFPRRSILTAATCAAAIALITWIAFSGPLALFNRNHHLTTVNPGSSTPARFSSPLTMLSFSRITRSIDDPLQHEARLLAADFTRAADFLRAQIPLTRPVAPRDANNPG